MLTIEDIVFREVELLHMCFIVTIEDILNIRHKAWHQYDGFLDGNFELIKSSSDGTESWYLDLDDWVGDKDRVYYSSVKMHETNRPYGEVTEIRISCHHHPVLDIHFKDFVDELITKFRRAPDCDLIIPQAAFPPVTYIGNVLSDREIFEREQHVKLGSEDIQDVPPDPDDTVRKYGSDKNLTKNDVRKIVAKFRFAKRELRISFPDYYESLKTDIPNNLTLKEKMEFKSYPPFALGTFRKWHKSGDFD